MAGRLSARWATILLWSLMGVFFFLPLAYLVLLSFQTFVEPGVFLPDLTFENYKRGLLEPYPRDVLINSVRVSAMVTAVCLALGLPLAMFIARESGAWQRIVLIIVIGSLFTNLVVRAFGWMVILGPFGIINSTLMSLELTARPIRMYPSEGAVVLALVQELLPIFVLLAAAGLQKCERAQEEAAMISGAGPVRIFLRVILPAGMPGIASGLVLVYLMAMGAFIVPEFLGGGRFLVMSTMIRQLVAKVTNYPFAAALSVLLILFTLAMLLGVRLLTDLLGRQRRNKSAVR